MNCFSQAADTSSQTSLDSLILFYTRSLQEKTLLYNGREYTRMNQRTIGHPFYASDQPQKGSLVYNGIFYPEAKLTYDIATDEIVMTAFENITISLLNERIAEFSIGDHRFTHIRENEMGVEQGYYEILVEGQFNVLAKHKKQLEQGFNPADPDRYVQYDTYFIRTDAFHQVTSLSALLSLFPGKGPEIRKYLRKNNLRFKKKPAETIVAAVEHYQAIKD